MRTHHHRGLAPLVLAILALGVTAPAFGGWWDDLFDDQVVPLEKILANPETFRGQTVTFPVQFHRLGKVDNPFYTKFETDWYLNFSVWADGAPLWDKEAYRKDFPYVFVRRGTEIANVFLAAPVYSRWYLTGEVSDVFSGKPWIEVTALRRIETQLDEPSLVRLVKGLMLRDLRRYDAAAQEFHAVDHKGLPPEVRVLAMREEALALHNAGRTAFGVARLATALDLAPGERRTTEAMTALRASLGLDPDGHPLPDAPAGAGGVPAQPDPAPAPAEPVTPGAEPAPDPAPAEPAPVGGTPPSGGGGADPAGGNGG